MQNDIKKISVTEDEINQIVQKLGQQITADYREKEPLLIGLLKGCNPFMADLLKVLPIYCSVDYMKVSSYSGTYSTGKVSIQQDTTTTVSGKDVIVVDDILDTGRTLQEIKNLFLKRGAKSVKLCVLLDKPEGRQTDIQADYVGGLGPNEFVVGYGLDYNERYRNLPYIGVLKEEIYSK